MNTYIIREYGHDSDEHRYVTSREDSSNEMYEGDSHEIYNFDIREDTFCDWESN